jgi:hypothetical protein
MDIFSTQTTDNDEFWPLRPIRLPLGWTVDDCGSQEAEGDCLAGWADHGEADSQGAER